MTDVSETQRGPRGRPTAKGLRTDDGMRCLLLVVNEADGAWTVHTPRLPGMTLSKLDMVALAESILGRAR